MTIDNWIMEHAFNSWNKKQIILPQMLCDLLSENFLPYMRFNTLIREHDNESLTFFKDENGRFFSVKTIPDNEYGEIFDHKEFLAVTKTLKGA